MTTIIEQYRHHCQLPSDINEHLPTLKRYSKECNHITELGVRHAVSTWAFLSAIPKKFVCVDYLHDYTTLPRQLAEAAGTEFEFHLRSTVDPEFILEPTDLLFIDTWHCYEQLSVELKMHHNKAIKYIIMHDTTSFGENGESDESNPIYQSGKGLWPAIEEFLAEHPEWQILEQYTNNNGLTILGRVGYGFKLDAIDLTIEFSGEWSSAESIRLKTAFDSSMQDESKLVDSVLTMPGMSGQRYRKLINKLVELTPDARYLEIGSWAGSTACSAMYGNTCKLLCIDNWSEFGGPKETFHQNIDIYGNDNVDFNYIENDYETVDYSQTGKYNIYLFDGPHKEHEQYAGISITQEALEDTYTLIVDDWNWDFVRNGTLNAIKDLNQTIVSSVSIRSSDNNIHPAIHGPESDWHNGYFIAVIKK